MTDTLHLGLPFIEGSQAQKHVTHNEALRALDVLVMPAARDRDHATPPASPAEGDRYIVKAPGADAFAGKDNQIAVYDGGAWAFYAPRAGWTCYVEDEAALVTFDGTAWQIATGAVLQNLERLGLGTSADAVNPFAAKLNKALWTAKYAGEGGDGALRYTLNKEAPGKVLSLLMQSDWSGRAEIGLVGSDDLSVKVSADGAGWKEALVANRETGAVGFPSGLVHSPTGLAVPLYLPVPVRLCWRLDQSRPGTPRTYTISSISGTTITLTTASVGQIFGVNMRELAAVRIWNTSKSPAQAAWVDWDLSATQMRVTDASHVAGWAGGDTIRLGDPNPTGDNTLNMMALDISGCLLATTGAVFPQKGVFLGVYVSSSNGPAAVDFSGTGAGGTPTGGNALSNGTRNMTSCPIPTPVPSPISNSNLLFIREQLVGGSTDLITAYARLLGVYV